MDTVKKIARLLTEKNLTLATAESCTGGLLGGKLTSVPGSSAWFAGGVVAYSNSVKVDLLGVPSALIMEHGAVSKEVVMAMAEGVARATGVEVGVAVTGVAGPDGSEDKPPGTVYLGVRTQAGLKWKLLDLGGDRQEVRASAVAGALEFLAGALLER